MTILGERFEVYPNRDSVPYLAEYGFAPSWNVRTFVREGCHGLLGFYS